MADVSGTSSNSTSGSHSLSSESDSGSDSDSSTGLSSIGNNELASSSTEGDRLSAGPTAQDQLGSQKTAAEQLAAEPTTADRLAGEPEQAMSQTPVDAKAAELVAENSHTLNSRRGVPPTQELDTQSLAQDVLQLGHNDPQLSQELSDSLAGQLSPESYEAFSADLNTAYTQQAQAYQNLAGDLSGTIEVDASAASALADKLVDNATTVYGTRSGSTRETLDVNELAYQLESAAEQDPALALGAKMEIDKRLNAQQLGELNRLVGGGDTFTDNMSLAVSHPVEGLKGAGKNLVNGLSDLAEMVAQGSSYSAAGDMYSSAAMVSIVNPELGEQMLDQAAAQMDAAGQIDIPSFELTNRAQQGGATIGTVVEVATGVGGLIKGGLKLATKADEVVEIVLRQQDEAGQLADNLPTERPSWRQSELDVGEPLEAQGYRPQVSFKDGEEVPYGTKGSTRPEYYREGISVEVKNYSVETAQGRSNLVRNVTNQAKHRAENLPPNTVQEVNIDVRGQNISRADLNQLIDSIVEKSDGILNPSDINILR